MFEELEAALSKGAVPAADCQSLVIVTKRLRAGLAVPGHPTALHTVLCEFCEGIAASWWQVGILHALHG